MSLDVHIEIVCTVYTLFQMDEYICVFISVYVYTKFGIKKKKLWNRISSRYIYCAPLGTFPLQYVSSLGF